jgi:hypothetical protein
MAGKKCMARERLEQGFAATLLVHGEVKANGQGFALANTAAGFGSHCSCPFPGFVIVSLDASKPFGLFNILFLRRLSLAFDVSFYDLKRRTAAGDDAITWTPEVIAPELFFDLRPEFLAKDIARFSFKLACKSRYSGFGMCGDE